MSMAVGIFGGGGSNGGGGGDVRLETNHQETLTTNGTHVVTPNEGYDGMRKATISVDVPSEGTATDKALAKATTLDGRLYNLWEVLPQVKADPRASGYACIMLAEYWQGYNSLVLKGANAFLTCDGDFYQMSSTTDEVTHYWHDGTSRMMDRWVAFLFLQQNTNYIPSNADTMPRNILVDGVMGYIDIASNVNRIHNLWTTEGSSVVDFRQSELTANQEETNKHYGKIISHSTKNIFGKLACTNLSLGLIESRATAITSPTDSVTNISLDSLVSATANIFQILSSSATQLRKLSLANCTSIDNLFYFYTFNSNSLSNLRYVVAPKLSRVNNIFAFRSGVSVSGMPNLIHIEVGQGFETDLQLKQSTFANCLKTDANDLVEDVVAHPTWSNLDQWLYNFEHLIVDKLADLSGQTAKTITLAATPYAAITSEIRAKMSAKNWNLASA